MTLALLLLPSGFSRQ